MIAALVVHNLKIVNAFDGENIQPCNGKAGGVK
jgi:hypothetical protein